MVTIYGTCVLIGGIGVLLRGPSGGGKSDVAVRLIDDGALLVADDQVQVRMDQGRLMATAPAPLAGLIEVRGIGILPVPTAATAEIRLVVDLVAADRVERLPEPETVTLMDRVLPHLALSPFDASTPAKLRLAAAAVAAGRLGAVPPPPAPCPG